MRLQHVYVATTPEARLELAKRLTEDPDILKPSGPYSVFSFSGVSGGTADTLIIRTRADLRYSESLKTFRLRLEERLGPELMKMLKVHTDRYPQK